MLHAELLNVGPYLARRDANHLMYLRNTRPLFCRCSAKYAGECTNSFAPALHVCMTRVKSSGKSAVQDSCKAYRVWCACAYVEFAVSVSLFACVCMW